MSEIGPGQGGWPTTTPSPVQQPPAPPGPPDGPPPSVPPSAGGRAVAALILAILGYVGCFFFTAIPAIFLARMELAAIDRGEAPIAGRSMSQAAFWLAIVATVCSCLPTIAITVMTILSISMSDIGF